MLKPIIGSFAATLTAACLLVVAARALPAAEKAPPIPAPVVDEQPAQATSDEAVAVFAGGCFWGVQGLYQHVKGVKNAVAADLLLGRPRTYREEPAGPGRRPTVSLHDLSDQRGPDPHRQGLHRAVERRTGLPPHNRDDDRTGPRLLPGGRRNDMNGPLSRRRFFEPTAAAAAGVSLSAPLRGVQGNRHTDAGARPIPGGVSPFGVTIHYFPLPAPGTPLANLTRDQAGPDGMMLAADVVNVRSMKARKSSTDA